MLKIIQANYSLERHRQQRNLRLSFFNGTMRILFIQSIVFTLLTIVVCSSISGCALNRPYPEKTSYMPDISYEASKANKSLPYRLKIRNTRVSAPFEGKSFVYRLPDDQWENDFYNEWFTYPRDLITESCIDALDQSSRFASVTSEDSLIKADYYLEGTLIESYLDRRNPNKPQSVLKIRWVLIGHPSPLKASNSSNGIWSKTYEERRSLPSNQLRDYVKSTAEGLKQILNQLVIDLSDQLSKDV